MTTRTIIYDQYLEHLQQIKSQLKNYMLEHPTRNVSYGRLMALSARVINIISQLYPAPHRYGAYFDRLIENYEFVKEESYGSSFFITNLYSFVDALIVDIELGPLNSLSGIIRGDLFKDYIQMAEHLLSKGYKDAAAVITGASLEAHLKSLCKSNNIDFEDAHGDPLKAIQINQNLYKASIYGKREMKQIISWLDIRNDAAHGNYDEYGEEDVRLFIEGIALFIERYPS